MLTKKTFQMCADFCKREEFSLFNIKLFVSIETLLQIRNRNKSIVKALTISEIQLQKKRLNSEEC